MAHVTISPPLVQIDAPLDIDDLTVKQMEGTGVLDVLLSTMRLHLGSQYEKERIRGPEYATVYLGAYTATLEQAISFMLAKERQGLELQLLTAQEAQIRDQMTKTPYEIQLMEAQIRHLDKQADLVDKQILLADAQLKLATKDLDLKQKQIDLAAQQLLLAQEQLKQAQAQTDFYKQKAITEKAQTESGVAKPGSVIASQIDLMKAQEDGYQRNAEQQAAQIWANTWNVRRQTDENTVAGQGNHLDDAALGAVMNQLAKGINVTLP